MRAVFISSLSASDMKYFAVKTTVGQERSVASILEARFHGIFIDFVGESEGFVAITDKSRAAVVFSSPKTSLVEKASVYVGKDGEPSEPLHATLTDYSDETGFGNEILGEALYDPLLLKTEGWADLFFRNPVKLKRGATYALTLFKTVEEPAAYKWFYGKGEKENIVFKIYQSETWQDTDYRPLFKLAEKPLIASILILPALKGYVFVEAGAKEIIADALQNIRHVKARPPMPVNFDTIAPHLVEKPLIDVLTPGQTVEIVAGPLKGITGKVIRVEKSRREVTLELREAAFQLPISVSIDSVRPVEKT